MSGCWQQSCRYCPETDWILLCRIRPGAAERSMPGGQVMSAPPSGRRPVKKSKGKQCTGANARVRLCRASAERHCRTATVCKKQAFAKLLRYKYGGLRSGTVAQRQFAEPGPLQNCSGINTVARTGYTGQKSFVESGQWEAAMPNDKRRCTRGGAALSRSNSMQKQGRDKATPENDMHET